MAQANAVKVQESLLRPIAGSTIEGDSNPAEIVHLTVRVRPRTPRQELVRTVRDLASKLPAHRRHLTREEHAALHGADRADLDKVKTFASQHGLAVTDSSVARRTVHLVGTVAAVEQAFGVDLRTTCTARPAIAAMPSTPGSRRTRSHRRGDLRLRHPPVRPAAFPHFPGVPRLQASPSCSHSFNPDQLAEIYDFPPDADGTGQDDRHHRALRPRRQRLPHQELDTYFKGLGLATPEIVDGLGGRRPKQAGHRSERPAERRRRGRCWTSRSRGPSRPRPRSWSTSPPTRLRASST